jgi:ParB family chromosome partitioning protein
MTIHTIPLSSILLCDSNPRTGMDPSGIESLAASILADGLLQNLVVAPIQGDKTRYWLVSGERRYRALLWLQERGQIPADYAVPAEIRSDLSDADILRIATVENVQRENLSPLDEAAAFARLLGQGAALEEVSAQTGLSRTTIKRRLALDALCDEVKQALASGAITLAAAEAFTLGTHEAQRDILQRLAAGWHYDADELRDMLLDQRPCVAFARFPLEQYQGTFTTDLFADDATTYFDDVEQFFSLQRQAVAALAEQLAETADWVEVSEDYHIPRWQYRPREDGEAAGVIINLSPSGEVEVLEGLVKRTLNHGTAKATADNPIAPKPKPAYSTPMCRYVAHHKSMAVQRLLLENPRVAKEVAVLGMLRASDAYRCPISLDAHDSLKAFACEEEPPVSYQAVENLARRFSDTLGLQDPQNRSAWALLLGGLKRPLALYDAIKALSDEDLDRLHLLLPILCFGQGDCDRLDTSDTLFNRIGLDLGVDMRVYWRPDTDFLSRRTRDQLLEILAESDLSSKVTDARSMKKAELVKALDRQFARVRALEHPDESDQKARDWLPGAMLFPAVSPTAQAEDTAAEEDDDDPYEDFDDSDEDLAA